MMRMGRRKGELHEIHRAEPEVEGEGPTMDAETLSEGAKLGWPPRDQGTEGASDPTDFAGVSDLVKGVAPTDLGATESQQGEGGSLLSPESRAAIEGADRLNVTVLPDGATEAEPQVPAGNPTEREEIKRKNFSRVAGGRVTRILEGLRLLKHCSNTATYEWDRDQHEKIFTAINSLFMEVEEAFVKAKTPRARSGPRKQLRFEV